MLRENPELVHIKKKKKETGPKPAKDKKEKKQLGYLTPFMVYRDSLAKEGNVVSYSEAQAMYRNLSDSEKMEYIKILLNLDTTSDKNFSINEQKIIKQSSGIPSKPITVYNMFVKDLGQRGDIDKKDLLKTASASWRTIDPVTKQKYEEKYQEEVDKWQKKMLEWIKTLPDEKQAEEMAKYGMLKKLDPRVAKRKLNHSMKEDSTAPKSKKANIINEVKSEKPEGSAVTVKILQNEPIQVEKSKKTKTNSVSDSDQSPKKKKSKESIIEEILSPSPKKQKFKEAIASIGSYPSLSTAHYFTVNNYPDKPEKAKKKYAKLSILEKKELSKEMMKIKNDYFLKIKKFTESHPKDIEKIRQFHSSNQEEQKEVMSWHKATSTDKEDSSDDDSDADSDSS